MLELTDGMILYHGSYCEVKIPDLSKCSDFKDFGKGFYLTSSKEQAEKFINTSLKKAEAQGIITGDQGYGVISKFCYHHSEEMKKYDIIAGKIADDATNVTILTYLIGAYGTIGSEQIWKN